jgi:hypothetical protein
MDRARLSLHRIFVLLTLLAPSFLFFCAADLNAKTAENESAPTEAEVKETIEKKFTENYASDYGNAKFDKVRIEFTGPVQVGRQVKKEVNSTDGVQSVWPVKAPVKITVTYSNNPSVRTVQRGVKSDDVFFFYRDAFDAWTFRTGSM